MKESILRKIASALLVLATLKVLVKRRLGPVARKIALALLVLAIGAIIAISSAVVVRKRHETARVRERQTPEPPDDKMFMEMAPRESPPVEKD